MAFFLFVPPVNLVPSQPELIAQHKKDLQLWLKEELTKLGIKEPPLDTVQFGAFQGTQIHPWTKGYSAVLNLTSITTLRAHKPGEFLRVSSLLRVENCLQLGSSWQRIGTAPTGMPATIQDGGTTPLKASMRQLQSKNSVRLDARFAGHFSARGEFLLESALSDKLAEAGIPVITNLSRLYCEWAPAWISAQQKKQGAKTLTVSDDSTSEYPSRPHRLIEIRLAGVLEKSAREWPDVTGKATLNSGVFGERKEPILEWKTPQSFDPFTFSANLTTKFLSNLHDLKSNSFRITKRQGRWAYLDRGRAYGLEIGSHLVGPGGAELHVIQFDTSDKEPDVAIAYVRREDPTKPLAKGDDVTFDQTRFPKSPWPPSDK